MTSKLRAQEIHHKRRQGLKDGIADIKKYLQPRLLNVASAEWLDMKKATLAPRSVKIEKADSVQVPLLIHSQSIGVESHLQCHQVDGSAVNQRPITIKDHGWTG
jgi:hypothetical protein